MPLQVGAKVGGSLGAKVVGGVVPAQLTTQHDPAQTVG